LNRTDASYGNCVSGACDVPIIEFEAGTLILDFVDARTHRLIWRGWAQHSIDDELDNQRLMARPIDGSSRRPMGFFGWRF
jgi:hypothetical protein